MAVTIVQRQSASPPAAPEPQKGAKDKLTDALEALPDSPEKAEAIRLWTFMRPLISPLLMDGCNGYYIRTQEGWTYHCHKCPAVRETGEVGCRLRRP